MLILRANEYSLDATQGAARDPDTIPSFQKGMRPYGRKILHQLLDGGDFRFGD